MTDMPSEAAIRELIRRVGYGDSSDIIFQSILAHPFNWKWAIFAAQMLEKYEPETLVDPALKRAREIYCEENQFVNHDNIRSGMYDNSPYIRSIVRALKEGMGS